MLFDLSERAKLRLTGSDRVRFLNGQVTNDVRKANANLSMSACVLNAKGKIDALIFVSANQEELFVDAEREQRETLAARLERYVIADDVTIEDVTEKFALFHILDESAPALPNDGHWRRAKRFGLAGWDLVVTAGERDAVLQSLGASYSSGSAEEAERMKRNEFGAAPRSLARASSAWCIVGTALYQVGRRVSSQPGILKASNPGVQTTKEPAVSDERSGAA